MLRNVTLESKVIKNTQTCTILFTCPNDQLQEFRLHSQLLHMKDKAKPSQSSFSMWLKVQTAQKKKFFDLFFEKQKYPQTHTHTVSADVVANEVNSW